MNGPATLALVAVGAYRAERDWFGEESTAARGWSEVTS